MRDWLGALAIAAGLATWVAPRGASANPDSDGDGVPDAVDVFPCDATSAAEAYAPALGVHGMLYGEDFWPVRLDDDYQDLVVTYNYGFKIEAGGSRVNQIRVVLNVLASGGLIDAGLGLQLPVPSSALSSATMKIGNGAAAALLPRGADQLLTFTISNDVGADLFPGAPSIVNAKHPSIDPTVQSSGPIELIVNLGAPQSVLANDAPFDLFMFRTGALAHETHLSRYCGTSAMNGALFNTGIDASQAPGGPCYVDQQGLPAMLVLPATAMYPLEGVNIAALFPQIVQWAASGGTSNQGWYLSPVASSGYPTPLAPSFSGGSSNIVPDLSCPCPSGYTGTAGSCTPVGNIPVVYDEQFFGGASPNAQCTDWNAWRGSLSAQAYYSSVTISGSNAPNGVTCSGDAANTLCQALRANTAVSNVACGGRTWATGQCGSGIEINANGGVCQCSSPGYTVRPCIGNANWGGANGATCSAPSQSLRVTCVEGISPPRTLSVQVSNPGFGRITSSPAGIDCGGDCSEPFSYGTTVTLTATPINGGVFLGWSGACSGAAPTCTLFVDRDVSAYAVFAGAGATTYSAQFTGGQASSQQCSAYNTWRSAIDANTVYNSVTIRGSNDPGGVSCIGPEANTICHALRTGQTTSVACLGRTWRTGLCGSGLELTTTGGICQCSTGHTVRPCIGNLNWGGANTSACNAPSQSLSIDCLP